MCCGGFLYFLFALVVLSPSSTFAQAVTGTIIGRVTDSSGAVIPGATVTLTNTGTKLTRVVVTDTNGEYAAPSLPTGDYTVSAEISGIQDRDACRTSTSASISMCASTSSSKSARSPNRSPSPAESPLVQTSSSELGTTVSDEQIETLPLNGRNFVSLTRTVPGVVRGIPGANIDGAGSLAWRASASFSANGQRPRDNNYMLDGVDNNETWLQTVVHLPERRRARRVQAADEHVLGGVRPLARRRRQPADQIGHQPASRQRVRVPPQRRVRREQLLQQPRRPGEAGLQPASVRRHARRPDLQGQDVLLRRLPGLPRRSRGRRSSRPCRRLTMRSGDFSELNRVIYDPLTHQPFPGNIIPSDRVGPSVASNILEPAAIPSRTPPARAAPTGQTINNYLINPTLTRQDNQYRRQGRSHACRRAQPLLRAATATRRRTACCRPRCRTATPGITFGAGDGNIKAQGFAFNDTHTFSSKLAERVPLRLELDQVLHDLDRLRHEPRRRRWAFPAST